MLRKLGLCLFLAGVMSAPAWGDEKAQSGKSKPAATPEEALEQFAKAAQAADEEGVLDVFAPQPRKYLAFMFEAADTTGRAAKQLQDTLEAKFGPDPAGKPPIDLSNPKKAVLQSLAKKAEILSKTPMGDNKVELKVKFTTTNLVTKADMSHEETVIAVKEAGGWKLIPPAEEMERLSKKDIDKSKAFAKQMADTLLQAAKDVKAGKYASREEANKAIAASMPKPDPDVLPAGFALPPPPPAPPPTPKKQ